MVSSSAAAMCVGVVMVTSACAALLTSLPAQRGRQRNHAKQCIQESRTSRGRLDSGGARSVSERIVTSADFSVTGGKPIPSGLTTVVARRSVKNIDAIDEDGGLP